MQRGCDLEEEGICNAYVSHLEELLLSTEFGNMQGKTAEWLLFKGGD
jgi:hypothetical protein